MRVIFIIILALVSLIPLWKVSFYDSHDGNNLVARFAAYEQAFADGAVVPRWGGNFNFGYGSPVLNFFYPLPGYLASFLHAFGASYELSFKIIISTAYIFSFFSFYWWMRQIFSRDTAIVGAILYGLLPYHFLNLYVRGDIGELVALSIAPLVFYFIEKQKKKLNIINVIGITVSCGLLILAHNGISLMFAPVILLYIFISSQSKKNLLLNLLGFGGGFALSMFFWFPALFEQRYVNGAFFIGDMYKEHFPTFRDLLLFRWGFGPDIHTPNGLSPHLGIVQLVFAAVSIVMVFAQKRVTRMFAYWLVILGGAIFISISYSSFIWEQISLLKMYQFPWRFIALASFALCVVATYGVSRIKENKMLLFIVVIACLLLVPYLQIIPKESQSDSVYESYTGNTYFHGEASTIWSAGDPGSEPKSNAEIIRGEGEVFFYKDWNARKTYTVVSNTNIVVKDNTLYYPGWKVYSDGKEIPIQFQDSNHRGFITYTLPQGKHRMIVEFTETKTRMFANLASLATLLVLSGLALVFLYRRNRHEK